jgi:glyoxylase-like metal-dependent hydrolase (beta-lactamase superfamily II)
MIPESDLFNVGNPFVAVYLLRTSVGYILIDTGFPNSLSAFLKSMTAYKIAVTDIKYIFVTHAHVDHVGLLGQLFAQVPSVKVVGVEETFKRIQAGATPIVPGRRALGWPGRVIKALRGKGKKPSRFPAVTIPADQKIVFDGRRQVLREIGIPADIVLLPGHTADSIGLLLDDGRLFCGDAAMNGLPGEGRHSIAAENVHEYHHSWDVMIGSGAKWIYPAHGPRFPVGDLKRYRSAVEGRSVVIE